jgi:hypothetical protein
MIRRSGSIVNRSRPRHRAHRQGSLRAAALGGGLVGPLLHVAQTDTITSRRTARSGGPVIAEGWGRAWGHGSVSSRRSTPPLSERARRCRMSDAAGGATGRSGCAGAVAGKNRRRLEMTAVDEHRLNERCGRGAWPTHPGDGNQTSTASLIEIRGAAAWQYDTLSVSRQRGDLAGRAWQHVDAFGSVPVRQGRTYGSTVVPGRMCRFDSDLSLIAGAGPASAHLHVFPSPPRCAVASAAAGSQAIPTHLGPCSSVTGERGSCLVVYGGTAVTFLCHTYREEVPHGAAVSPSDPGGRSLILTYSRPADDARYAVASAVRHASFLPPSSLGAGRRGPAAVR